MATVRFAQLVARSGQPEVYTLWTEPEKDRAFQRALKEHRIMTVHQGQGTDYGEIGYVEGPGELLVFPRSLRSFEGKRVVGIKYELLAPPRLQLRPRPEPEPAKETPPPPARDEAKAEPAPPPAPEPRPVIVPFPEPEPVPPTPAQLKVRQALKALSARKVRVVRRLLEELDAELGQEQTGFQH